MSQRRRLLRLVIPLAVLIVILVATGIYIVRRPTHVVTAEFLVRNAQPLVLTEVSQHWLHAGLASDTPSIAETIERLLRSRAALTAALRKDEVKSLPVIQSCEDPISFLTEKIQVTAKSPALIELAIYCQEQDGAQYETVVSAIADTLLNDFIGNERRFASERLQKLESLHNMLNDRAMTQSSNLESLAETLNVELSDDVQSAPPNPLLARRGEKMLDALASEIARLEVSMILDGNFERQQRMDTLKRLNEEYDRQTMRLVQERETQQAQDAHSKRSFVIDLKKRELERLQQHVGHVADYILQAKADLEMPSRVELISSGTLTKL